MNPRILLILIVVVAVAAFIWHSQRPQLPPERAVMERIEEGIAAAERRDVGALMDIVSDDFKSERLTRRQLKTTLFLQMQKAAWSRIFVVDQEIQASSDTVVEVSLDTVLARGGEIESIEDVLPDSAGAWHIELRFEREDDDQWRVTWANPERVQLRSLLP